MAQTTITDDFGDITKALDEIELRLPFIVDRQELGDAMCQSVELGHRVQALQTQLALQCTTNGVAANEGQRTIGQYVAARSNNRSFDIDRLTKTGKWLRDYPIFAAAHGVELTDAHIQHMRKTLDTNYDTHTALKLDQQFLVDTAATCSFAGFVKACEYWIAFKDPDGKEPKDQIDNAKLRIGKGRGGRGQIDGMCDAVTAQEIKTAVEHEAEKLRRSDKDAGIDRTDGARNMAALHALVTRGFARDNGTFPAPLGNIVMSLKVAEWALATLSGEIPLSDTVPVHPTNIDGRCELIDGTPIHPFLAVRALGLMTADGVADRTLLRRYIMDADSRLLDVSVNARSAPEWMRTAALVETCGQCGTHGCTAPHHWLQMDHIDPVDNGGETRFDNIQPQCTPDNQAKGATTGLTAWRDRIPPARRRPPKRPGRTNADDDADNDPDKQPF